MNKEAEVKSEYDKKKEALKLAIRANDWDGPVSIRGIINDAEKILEFLTADESKECDDVVSDKELEAYLSVETEGTIIEINSCPKCGTHFAQGIPEDGPYIIECPSCNLGWASFLRKEK